MVNIRGSWPRVLRLEGDSPGNNDEHRLLKSVRLPHMVPLK